jgi:VWFA-related protein
MKALLGGLMALALTAQQPQFRGGTYLILIDATVVAKDGTPIEGLTAEQFEVFIDGRRRPIERVEFVRAATAPTGGEAAPAGVMTTTAPGRDGRIIMLAIDQASFPVSARASAREAATRVVNSVTPADYLGMVAFPGSIEIAPTRNHIEVRNAISRITGERMETISPRFNLSASEASLLKSKDFAARAIVQRECAKDKGNVMCAKEVESEGGGIADALEQQAMQSITGLRGLLDGLKAFPGRKTLLVVSAGIPMSTNPSGRPNVGIETDEIGRRAAAANVSLYVFYMNVHFLRFFSAEYGKQNTSFFNDVTMFGQGLERFSNSAGGTFFQVQVQSDPFVARAMRESSATYVLTVEALPAERDGKEHFIRVETKQRGADIRYRKIAMIPKESSKF